jgi:hypothetical protein
MKRLGGVRDRVLARVWDRVGARVLARVRDRGTAPIDKKIGA